MQTAQLDQIVRQKDPELLKAVEHLSRGEIADGDRSAGQQGRVTEIADPQQRIAAIAKSYAASPETPSSSRPTMPRAARSIRPCVQNCRLVGIVDSEDHAYARACAAFRYDRRGPTWAARYQAGDVLHYQRGSKDLGIEKHSYAQVIATNPKDNLSPFRNATAQQ